MSDSDGTKQVLGALHTMARLRKLGLDVDTDDNGRYFEFILPVNDPRNIGTRIVRDLLDQLLAKDILLRSTDTDFRIKVYLADCTPKEGRSDD